jgi:DNA polymerase III subunit delta
MLLSPKDLAVRIRKGTIDPVYLFVGDTAYRMAEATHFVIDAVEKKTGQVPDRHAFSLGENPKGVIQEILTACNTFSMFGATQVVVVEDVPLPFLAPMKKIVAPLLDYCASPSPRTILLLRGQAKPVRNKPALAKLDALGAVVLLQEEREGDLVKRVIQRARKLGLNLGNGEASLIVDRVGNDQGLIQGDLERIALTVHPETRPSMDELDGLVGDSREFPIYAIIESVARGDRPTTFRMADALLAGGTAPLAIVGMLASGYRDLWLASSVGHPDDLRALIGGRPGFVLQGLMDQSRKIGAGQFPQIWEHLYAADRRMKSSRIPPDDLLFELLVDCMSASSKP